MIYYIIDLLKRHLQVRNKFKIIMQLNLALGYKCHLKLNRSVKKMSSPQKRCHLNKKTDFMID